MKSWNVVIFCGVLATLLALSIVVGTTGSNNDRCRAATLERGCEMVEPEWAECRCTDGDGAVVELWEGGERG